MYEETKCAKRTFVRGKTCLISAERGCAATLDFAADDIRLNLYENEEVQRQQHQLERRSASISLRFLAQ